MRMKQSRVKGARPAHKPGMSRRPWAAKGSARAFPAGPGAEYATPGTVLERLSLPGDAGNRFHRPLIKNQTLLPLAKKALSVSVYS